MEKSAEEIEGENAARELAASIGGGVKGPGEDDEDMFPPYFPIPHGPRAYDLTEEEFWSLRHLPVGSVLTFTSPGREEESDPPYSAVMVEACTFFSHGVKVVPKYLGASTKNERTAMEKLVKNHGIHLCYPFPSGCPIGDANGLHLTKFWWHPPGDFQAEWLSRASKQLIREGLEMSIEQEKALGSAGKSIPAQKPPGDSEVEARLAAVKRKASLRRVSFNPMVGQIPAPVGGGSGAAGLQAGAHPLGQSQSSALVSAVPVVKPEPIRVDSSGDEAIPSKKGVKRSKGLGAVLAQAVIARQGNALQVKEAKSSNKSSSSKKKKKKKSSKKDKKDEESSSEENEEESSSEDSMMPPLKKKSLRSPGSVFRLLENQAIEALSQDGVLDEEYKVGSSAGQRPKMHTYYQLALKPLLDPKTRDCRELGVVARALDLLRDGRLDELADLLAARMIAIDTATKQGWQTARHLEVYTGEDQGTAPAHILLSAQKYNRQVEKAGGKGSWSRSQNTGWGDWRGEPRGKGKKGDTKGKPKKGKDKGKGGWKTDPKEKGEGKEKEWGKSQRQFSRRWTERLVWPWEKLRNRWQMKPLRARP